jgi:hypothetical protein
MSYDWLNAPYKRGSLVRTQLRPPSWHPELAGVGDGWVRFSAHERQRAALPCLDAIGLAVEGIPPEQAATVGQ